jgi:hypothetical protein
MQNGQGQPQPPVQPATPPAQPQEDWFAQNDPETKDPNVPDIARIANKDRGAGPALKRANPLMIPVNLVKAFIPSDKPEDADELSASMAIADTTKLPLPLAVALHRIVIAPMIKEHETAMAYEKIAQSKGDMTGSEAQAKLMRDNPKEYIKQQAKQSWRALLGPVGMFVGGPDVSDAQHMANVHHIAKLVPLLGPMAASIEEHYLQGDKSGAVTELLTSIAGGKLLEGAGKAGLRKIAPTVRKIAGEEIPVLKSQTGDKGAHVAEQGTKLAGLSGERQLKKFGERQGEAAQRSMSNIAKETAVKTGKDLEANQISAGEMEGEGIPAGNRSKPLPSNYQITPEESVNGSSLTMHDEAGNEMGSIGMRDSSAIPGKNASEISDIQLHKFHRGQGYGQALYEEAAKHAASNGDDFLVSSGKPTDLANDTWKRLEEAHPDQINYVNGRWQWKLKNTSAGTGAEAADLAGFRNNIEKQWGTSSQLFTDEGLRKAGGIPQGVSLRDLESRGFLKQAPSGHWEVLDRPKGANPLTMAPEAVEAATSSKAALASSSSFGEAAQNIRAAAAEHFRMLDEATNGELSALKAERSDLFRQLRNPANDASEIRGKLADVAKREDKVFAGNGVGNGRTALDAARLAWKKSIALDELDARITRVTKESMGPGGIDAPLKRQIRGAGMLKQLDQMDPDKLQLALGDPAHVKSIRTLAALLDNGQNVSKMTIAMKLLRGSRLFGVMHHPVAVAGSEGLSFIMGKILTSPTLSGTMGKMLQAGAPAPAIASALAKAMESQRSSEDVD